MLSKGTIYRWGERIKDFGECVGHVKIFNVFILGWLADPIIAKGKKIRDSVLKRRRCLRRYVRRDKRFNLLWQF